MKPLLVWLFVLIPWVVLGGVRALAGIDQVGSTPLAASGSDQVAESDWAGIRAAYRAGKYRWIPSGNGFETRNFRQAWSLGFDGRGFLLEPDLGDWAWGLRLTSFGFGGMEEDVSGSAQSVVRGGRLEYGWCSGLCEWFVNGTRGLEHGFTFEERPVGSGPLRVRLAVRGNLQGQILPGGNGIGFADASGEVVLTYTGLRVFDALGVDQAASLTVANGQVQITVDEASAVYPLTIDPIAQEVYLKASNTDAGDGFGRSVAVSGNTVVVGAPWEDSAARGINGNQADNSNQDSGAAYVFVKAGGVWSQQAYLKASNGDSNDWFASALALEGDALVVGARGEDSASPGVNGDQSNNNADSSGAVYAFQRIGSNWVQEAYLKASNADLGDQFGYAVAVGDGSIAVGAFSEDSKSSGVNGGQADNSVAGSGASYVFVKSGGTWVQQAYVKPSNPLRGAVFGIAISISQDVLLVGAYGESSDGIGVNGSQVGVGATDCGAAYIFERTAGVWAQTTYMKPNVNRHFILFGFAVAVVDGIAVVGVPLENEAYVYERSVTGWVHQSLLEPEALGNVQAFGVSVALSGDSLLVGAQGESGAAVGLNGNPGATPLLDSSGAAYLYRRRGSSWSQEAYMKASNAGAQDYFGMSVAMAGDLAVVGAPDEDGGFTGPYTSDYDNSAPGAGAAFVFQLHADSANYCGPAVANSLGLAANLIHLGSLSIVANDFTLQVDGLPPGQMGFFLSSMGQDFVPNPGGSQGHLCLGRDNIGRHNRPHELRVSNAMGTFELTLDLQNMPVPLAGSPILAGQTWNFQAWYRDLNPGPTSNFSNGLTARFR